MRHQSTQAHKTKQLFIVQTLYRTNAAHRHLDINIIMRTSVNQPEGRKRRAGNALRENHAGTALFRLS